MTPTAPQVLVPYCPPHYQLVPEIYVASLPTSLAFYAALGFHTDWVVPDIFAQVSWDSCLVFLKVKPVKPDNETNVAAAAGAGNVRIMLPDVDTKYAECRDRLGLEITQEIGDRKFVLRDFMVRDPDGFEVRFGSWLGGIEGMRQQRDGPEAEGALRGGDTAL